MQTNAQCRNAFEQGTNHTSQTSPKVISSFLDHPLGLQVQSINKLRVFSNPKAISQKDRCPWAGVDWGRVQKGLEQVRQVKRNAQRGYRLTLISGLPTSKKALENAK